MGNVPKFFVLMLAAGKGNRFGGKKQILQVDNDYLIKKPLRTFLSISTLSHLTLVTSQTEIPLMTSLLRTLRQETKTSIHCSVIEGGEERYQSVYKGLSSIKDLCGLDDIVLIHDSARPHVLKKDIESLMHRFLHDPETHAASLAYPVTDTIKTVENGIIRHHLDRSTLWGMMTPQAFRFQTIYNGYQKYFGDGGTASMESDVKIPTDDTMMVDTSIPVYMVQGDRSNIKITFPSDVSDFLMKY